MSLMDIGQLILTIIPSNAILFDYLFFLIGIGIIVFGILIQSGRLDQRIRRGGRKMQTREQLAKWGMFFTYDDDGNRLIEEISVLTTRFQSSGMILFGAALMLVTVTFAIVAFVLFAGNMSFFFDEPYMFIALSIQANGIGYLFAAKRMRKNITNHYIAAELRRHTIADYRSKVFLPVTIILWLLSILNAGIATAIDRYHLLHISTNALFYPMSSQAAVILEYSMVFIAGILIILNEILIRAVIRSPRIIFFSYPPLAMKIDTMIRGKTISILQTASNTAVAVLLTIQVELLMSSPIDQIKPLWIGLSIEGFLAMIIVIPLFLAMTSLGHIGGTITGWPWQKKLIEQNAN